MSPAGEDVGPPVPHPGGGAPEQGFGVEVVLASADDEGGRGDARQVGLHIEGVLGVQG